MHSYIIISHVVHVLWKIGLFTKTRPLSVAKSSNALNVPHQPQKHLAETQEAKQACESWRSQLGDALIKRYEPVFRHRPDEPTFDRVFVMFFFSEAVATAPEYVDDGAAAHRWLHRACSCSAWDKWRISEWQRHRTAFTALKSHASKFDKLTPCFKSLEVFMVHWSYSTQSIQ